MRGLTGFDRIAVTEGINVAYGQGTVFGLPGMSLVIGHEPRAWNAGHQLRRNVGDQDDVSYVDALIDDLVALHRADPGRIYLVGLSNRGVLAHHFAARRPSRLAAMVAALASLTQLRHPPPACSLPVLVIHGARDEVIPLRRRRRRRPRHLDQAFILNKEVIRHVRHRRRRRRRGGGNVHI